MEREIINYLATLSDLVFDFALCCVVLCCVVLCCVVLCCVVLCCVVLCCRHRALPTELPW